MFQNGNDGAEKGRSRMIMAAAAVAVVLIFGAVLLWGTFSPEPPAPLPAERGLPNAKHAGDPDFEKNKGLVSLVNKKFFTQANMLGQNQALATGDIMNFTDKTLTGVELRGSVIGKDGQVKATTLAAPVPRVHQQIAPNKSVAYTVRIDGAPPTHEIDDITVEVVGLEFAP